MNYCEESYKNIIIVKDEFFELQEIMICLKIYCTLTTFRTSKVISYKSLFSYFNKMFFNIVVTLCKKYKIISSQRDNCQDSLVTGK